MRYSFGFLPLVTPIIFTTLIVILVIALRWFTYKERMAQICSGMPIEGKRSEEERYKIVFVSGLIVGLLGLALTVGLLTIGIGPWLLFGLLPLFVGLALILAGLVLQPSKPKDVSIESNSDPELGPSINEDEEKRA